MYKVLQKAYLRPLGVAVEFLSKRGSGDPLSFETRRRGGEEEEKNEEEEEGEEEGEGEEEEEEEEEEE